MSYMYDDWWNDLSIETKQNILKNINIINPDEIWGILNFNKRYELHREWEKSWEESGGKIN